MSPSVPAHHERREFASEIKFVLDAATADRVRAWARRHLAPDPNAKGTAGDTYHVASLYLDTPDFSVFRRTGNFQHSKFRIRRYNDEVIFLERKLKIAGQVAKHRTTVTPQELERLTFATDIGRAGWTGAWFERRANGRRLQPVCQIDYFRTARILVTPTGPIRLTLDESIRALPARETRFLDTAAAKPVTETVVLELKYRRDLPVLFRALAAEFGLNPSAFSKYRTAVQMLGLIETPRAVSAPGSTPALPATILPACSIS